MMRVRESAAVELLTETTAAGGCAQQRHQFRRYRQRRRTGQYQFFQHPGSDERHTGAVTGTRLLTGYSFPKGRRSLSAGRWSQALETASHYRTQHTIR